MNSLVLNSFQEKTRLHFFLDSLKVDNSTKEKISLIYQYAEVLHHGQLRKDWSKYFEHPVEVAKILEEIGWQNKRSIIIALLHDVIEDTEIEHDILCELFWEKIADSVEKISKKPWIQYLDGAIIEDKKTRSIRNTLKKWVKAIFWKDFPIIVDIEHFDTLTSNYENLMLNTNRGTIHFYIIIENEDNKKIDQIIERCKTLCKRHKKRMLLTKKVKWNQDYSHIKNEDKDIARELRDEDYFWNMDSLDTDTLNVKFADRIHNLRTIYSLWKDDIKRKVRETKKYFLKVAKKRNSKAYYIILEELRKIEVHIKKLEIDEALNKKEAN